MSERIILCVEYTYHTIRVLNCWNLYIYVYLTNSDIFQVRLSNVLCNGCLLCLKKIIW